MSISLEQVRLSVTEPDTLLLYGVSTEEGKAPQLSVTIKREDGQKQALDVEFSTRTNADIRRRLATMQIPATEQLIGRIALPADWRGAKEIRLAEPDGNVLRRLKADAIEGLVTRPLDYSIDAIHPTENGYDLSGWTVSSVMPEIEIFDADGKRIDVQTRRALRSDVSILYPEFPEDTKFGYTVEIRADKANAKTPWDVRFVLPKTKNDSKAADATTGEPSADPATASGGLSNDNTATTGLTIILAETKIDARRFEQLVPHEPTAVEETTSIVKKVLHSLRHEGPVGLARRVWHKLKDKPEPSYEDWLAVYDVSKDELAAQRKTPLSENIVLSVVVPVYRTRPDHMTALIRSMQAQTWPHWELCLADASAGKRVDEAGETTPAVSPLADLLNKESAADPRIKVAYLTENGGISDNTNAAIAMATGELIVFADHDDLLAPNALYEIAKAYLEDKTREAIYSDEDKIDIEGEHRFGPHFKSDYNPDLLRSVNYMCHIFAVTRELLNRVGMLRREFDGAQDYDFNLRACEAAKQVYHIPKILYHWRAHPDSTAENPQSKLYAFEAGKRAIQAHYDRTGLPARVTDMEFYGTYRSVYEWKERPLISILIPNKDHIEDLDRCIRSIEEKSTYRNVEIIVIENNSEEAETFEYYEKVEQITGAPSTSGEMGQETETPSTSAESADAAENGEKEDGAAVSGSIFDIPENAAPIPVRVVRYTGTFNFSAVNNFGAQYANGEYLLLLNNDTELIRPEALWELVSVCMREDVGAVGARLYYPDNTIQHAGVILGVGPYGGFAGHCFVNVSRYDVGYMNRLICMCDYSAVTGACLMTPKAVYDEVGGLSEDFVVALNDIDYCLKVGRTGRRVVYNPYAEFYHYESRSRGYDENNKEKEERLIAEVHRFQERWKDILTAGDPMYNRNLSLNRLDWGMKEMP